MLDYLSNLLIFHQLLSKAKSFLQKNNFFSNFRLLTSSWWCCKKIPDFLGYVFKINFFFFINFIRKMEDELEDKIFYQTFVAHMKILSKFTLGVPINSGQINYLWRLIRLVITTSKFPSEVLWMQHLSGAKFRTVHANITHRYLF